MKRYRDLEFLNLLSAKHITQALPLNHYLRFDFENLKFLEY